MNTPTVSEWMQRTAKTFGEDDPMRQAVNWLAESSASAVPVLNSDNQVVGLLSEKDALRTIARWTYDQVAGGTVADHMSPLSVKLAPDMDLLRALRAFLECNFACLPVMDGNRLVGHLTRNDLLQGMVAWAGSMNQAQDERQSARPEIARPSSIEEMQRVAASHTPDQLAEIFRER